jgi:ATP-dependent Clp protease ATP-binding subunit ClpC
MDKLMRFFTEASRRALQLAQQEAERMHHAQVGTEHLLLGLMREKEGVASRVLRELGLQSGDVQHWIERLGTARRRPHLLNTELDLSPRTKRVLELAKDEAKRRGDPRIDTQHILLGPRWRY